MAKYSERALLLLAGSSDPQAQVKRIGPALVFERLWEQSGIDQIIRELLKGRRYRFEVERAVFVSVLHRLMNPGSDRQAERWKDGYRIAGDEGLELQHFYRAMDWLGSPLKEQPIEARFAPRCVKDELEEEIFRKRRDLFTPPPVKPRSLERGWRAMLRNLSPKPRALARGAGFTGMDLVFFDTTSIYHIKGVKTRLKQGFWENAF